MLNTNELGKATFPKPVELMIADVFYVRLNRRTNHVLFKDLSDKNVHYSVFNYGNTIDMHKTLETETNPLNKHIALFKKELDWQLLAERMAQDIYANPNPLARITRTNSSECKDLDFKFIPITELKELFSHVVRGNRWTFDVDFFDNFESAFRYAKLRELSESSPVMGWSVEGFFTLSYGKNCILFNTNKLSESIEKNIQLSLRP